jgi:NADH dehydrogenase
MAFLPFYVPNQKQLKIVIVGGGYAGIAALITISRYLTEAEVTIVDPRAQHIKITHLHETFRSPLSDFLVPFSVLERRFGCRRIQTALTPDESLLQQWQTDKCLALEHELLEFDYLLIASGSSTERMDRSENALELSDFYVTAGSELLQNQLKRDNPIVSVVGGGATGIQFLFEIAHFLRREKIESKLRLIDGEERVLKQFTSDFARYAQARMTDLGIDYHPNTFYRGQDADKVALEDRQTGECFELPSTLSLLFLGKKPENLLQANAFGQARAGGKTLQNIFVAGDCSRYRSFGSNTLTAQAAVRKGKLAARNILRHSGAVRVLEPYLHRDLGYVVSLGPSDAVGWLALEGNVVGGFPALVVKELVEAQYDLLLAGIDTYLI